MTDKGVPQQKYTVCIYPLLLFDDSARNAGEQH